MFCFVLFCFCFFLFYFIFFLGGKEVVLSTGYEFPSDLWEDVFSELEKVWDNPSLNIKG